MEIVKVEQDKKQYLDLLLLADEQEDMIDRYLEAGDLYVLRDEETVGVCVVLPLSDTEAEIKNIAVRPDAQRRGYGKAMIAYALRLCGERGLRTVYVGTGECPGILGFYRSCGFAESHWIPGFFTDNYDHPIIEEGILLVDMVYLKQTV